MKIVVLCGGLSPERNVSISSGTKVAAALMSRGHKVVLADMFFGFENYEGDLDRIFDNPPPLGSTKIDEQEPDLDQIKASRKLKSPSAFGYGVLDVCAKADIVYIGMHGACGEDGRVQATFDLLGIPYTGSGYLGSAIAMDKDFTKRLVKSCGVLTPNWVLAEKGDDLIGKARKIGLPLVVKPVDSGSSIGVAIVHKEDELKAALAEAEKHSSRIVLEQYIEGREIQIAFLDDKALPSIEIIPAEGFYDYKNKYQPGAAKEICPAEIPADVEKKGAEAVLAVKNVLGLKAYSRADFILTETGELYFLEINTLPGMTPTSLVPQEAAAVGIDYPELCQKIIDISMREREVL